MNRERLQDLIDAYGSDPRCWPEGDRMAATAWMAEHADVTARLLSDAHALDAALDASPRPVVSHELRQRVIASAAMSPRPGVLGWLSGFAPAPPSRSLWLSGAGCAAAVCAGVLVGQTLTGPITADLQADAVLDQAMLADVDETELLG